MGLGKVLTEFQHEVIQKVKIVNYVLIFPPHFSAFAEAATRRQAEVAPTPVTEGLPYDTFFC
jgi:hypothetical protein